jgi:hemolysin D
MSKASSNTLTVNRSGSNDPTLPAILEFQWPSTAIVNAPVPRSARGIVWILASMVAVMIAILGLIPIDQVVSTRGIVVSQSRTVLVQPLDTAIVRSIEVREGQRVKAGQMLARLDPTFATADVSTLAEQLSVYEAETARLQAESAGLPFNYPGTDPNRLLQAAIYAHRQAEFDAKLDNYSHKIAELNSIIARSQSDAAAYRERLRVAQEVEHMKEELYAAQVASRASTLEAVDTRAEMQRAVGNAEQTASASKLEKAALESEQTAYVQSWRADVAQSLAEATAKATDTRAKLNKANLHRQMVELRSERDAIVQAVAKVSVGSVLQSGQQFITLVPADAPLEIEANISGRDDGFVHVHDPVAIKFDTFPYSQYGMATGIVRVVSPDAFTPQDEVRNPTSALPMAPSNPEPFYRARITLTRIGLHDVPAGFHVSPGMPVTADIKVGRRTVLKYLFGWFVPVAKEGMREPSR